MLKTPNLLAYIYSLIKSNIKTYIITIIFHKTHFQSFSLISQFFTVLYIKIMASFLSNLEFSRPSNEA